MKKHIHLLLLSISVLCLLFISCTNTADGAANLALTEKAADALRENNMKALAKYLKRGLDPNATIGNTKNTLLHIALYGNNTEAVRLLTDAGADIARGDQNGLAPLSLAAAANNAELVRLFLDKGADVNHVNTNKIFSTALMEATDRNAVDAMKVLLESGADIDVLDLYKYPAVGFAVDRSHYEALVLLVEAGADVNFLARPANEYLLETAIKRKNKKIEDYLRSKGAIGRN